METKAIISVRASTEEVARIAYSLWEQEGRPSGRDQEHWLKAEAQLRAVAAEAGKKQAPATAAAKVTAPVPPVKVAAPALASKPAVAPTVAVSAATPPALPSPKVELPKGKRKGRRV